MGGATMGMPLALLAVLAALALLLAQAMRGPGTSGTPLAIMPPTPGASRASSSHCHSSASSTVSS
jgi:hypothetical protein